MIRNLFFAFFIGFFINSSAYAEEKLEQQKQDLFELMEAGLQCQSTAAVALNYYNIYLGFKQGLEKIDVENYEMPGPVAGIKPMFDGYEDLLGKIKNALKQNHGVQADQIEFMRYMELKDMLNSNAAHSKLKPEFIRDIFLMLQECHQKLPGRRALFD